MLCKNFFHRCVMAVAGVALLASFASAEAITVYNQDNPPSDTNVAYGWYTGFGVQFVDTDLTSDPAATLPSTLYLDSMTLRRYNNTDPIKSLLLKVYSSVDAAPTSWLGDSNETNDMSGMPTGNVTYTFDALNISPSTTYYFYFSYAAGDPTTPGYTDSWDTGRLIISGDANYTYSSGNLLYWTGSEFEVRSEAYDSVFAATFSTEPPNVPEPSTAVLLLGVFVSLVAFRRTRK